ncbi:immunity protein [Loigolactobacillus coryniformis]|uniref:immunity protein n=1 Tax=Loigolactobacillus coryniformis TaxID=1610 RepID=UPI00345DE497
MFERLGGIGFLLISLWQFYAFYNSFRTIHQKGNQATSAFASLAIWYGLAFGIFFPIGNCIVNGCFLAV